MPRPATTEHAPYHAGYISLATGESVTELMRNHSAAIFEFYNALPESKADYAYASGKWTIKEMLQHIIDSERIFSYRVLRIARADKTPLPGFEENDYAAAAAVSVGKRSMASLKEELNLLRQSTDAMLASLTPESLQQTGTVNNHTPISANAVAFILFGHLLHHKNILEQRYL
ncbi:DinB family protein [Deminuibacter soli]|uniref:DinB family protein n=1 Tax=Deminuibacter soli TaxID=2291815 RepID=A0A3E1NIB2_9BACT|nr:DinB family protein [Deminuibacter soli]RFM27686.1 DinB family protein [Deminuibacter soli]